jgi:hypothetical protein
MISLVVVASVGYSGSFKHGHARQQHGPGRHLSRGPASLHQDTLDIAGKKALTIEKGALADVSRHSGGGSAKRAGE